MTQPAKTKRPAVAASPPAVSTETAPAAAETQPETVRIASPLAEATAQRTALREALAANNRLITSLRRQKKQSRLVETTLSVLKELRNVAS